MSLVDRIAELIVEIRGDFRQLRDRVYLVPFPDESFEGKAVAVGLGNQFVLVDPPSGGVTGDDLDAALGAVYGQLANKQGLLPFPTSQDDGKVLGVVTDGNGSNSDYGLVEVGAAGLNWRSVTVSEDGQTFTDVSSGEVVDPMTMTLPGAFTHLTSPDGEQALMFTSNEGLQYQVALAGSGGGLPTTVDSAYEGLSIVYGPADAIPDPSTMVKTIYVALPEPTTTILIPGDVLT